MSETQFLVILAAGTIVQYLIYCLYLRNLSSLLKAIQPPNRYMPPDQVWLLALWAINLICGYLDVQELEYLRFDIVRNVCRGIDIALYSFLIIWQFRTVYAIAVSIEQEYKSRSLQVRRRPTYIIGLAMVILSLTYIADFLPENYFTSTVSKISSFGNMIFWIIYWVQTHRYKKKIQAMPEYPQQDSPIFSNLY